MPGFAVDREQADLVSTKWLVERLGRPDIAVVDASVSKIDDLWLSDRAAFEAGHIPGARFADLVSDFSDPEAPFSFTRPTVARLASSTGATLGSCDLVADALADHFPLELGEGEKHIERQPSHA
jgi:thiosulfate/3-mercaptopyruvate sulfurtransferase